MELAAEPPECEFRVIAETRGLEFAAQVREDMGDLAAGSPAEITGPQGLADSQHADCDDSG